MEGLGKKSQAPGLAHWLALLAGNVALALGPWSVRLADSGPVAAGFWRLALAVPLLALLARTSRQPLGGMGRGALLAVAGAGLCFAFDIASWHIGIERTRLANATLFGNSGSLIIMAWGLFALRRAPRGGEWAAFALAIAGSAILMGRSLEIDARTLAAQFGEPDAMIWPKSNTERCSHTRMTSATSCSTSRMPSPLAARVTSRSPKASVSLSSRPDAGSSSSSTEGRAARARPSSTSRA